MLLKEQVTHQVRKYTQKSCQKVHCIYQCKTLGWPINYRKDQCIGEIAANNKKKEKQKKYQHS